MTPPLQERTIVAEPTAIWLERWSPFRWFELLSEDLRDLRLFRYVLRGLVATELKTRYQRSVLGFVWTLLNPILMMTVMALVFSQVMRLPLSDYALYLFSGLIPWQFVYGAVTNSGRTLLANEPLIKKIEVPKFLFPLTCLLVAAVNMALALVALFLLLTLLGATVHVQLVLLPAAFVLLGAFTLGISAVAMTLVSRYRDFEHILAVGLQAAYFVCPILYPPEFVAQYPSLITLNPMAYLLAFFHDALYYGVWPSGRVWAGASASAAVALALGYLVYKRFEARYVFWL